MLRNDGCVAVQFARGDYQVGQLFAVNSFVVQPNQPGTATVTYDPTVVAGHPYGSVTLLVEQNGFSSMPFTAYLQQPFVPTANPIGYGFECGKGYSEPFDLNSSAWIPFDNQILRVRLY